MVASKLHVRLRGHGGFTSQKVASSRFGTDTVYMYISLYIYTISYIYIYTYIYIYMHIIISTYFYNLYNITFKNIYTLQYYIQIYIYICFCLPLEKKYISLGIYARMHYVICILCAIRIQTRVSQQFVQSGNYGKTSLVTADCDSVNSSLRAKKQFAAFY